MGRSLAGLVSRGVLLLALCVLASGCSSSTLTCPAGQTACGGACFDLTNDTLHCGACGTSCLAGSLCVGGTCECPSTTPDVCGAQCVDRQTNPSHCGTCYHSCGLGTCSDGGCTCDQPSPPILYCPDDPVTGTCVDTTSTPAHCGSCNNRCNPGFSCVTASCTCVPPSTICGTAPNDVCTDTFTDPRNCGTCGNVCATGQVCSSGSCVQQCTGGRTLCGGVCVDTQTDPSNCGSCGNFCGGFQSCVAGRCQATCTTQRCGTNDSLCCPAPVGTGCCTDVGGSTCKAQHKNFPGVQGLEQTYYDCTPASTYTVDTAKEAARIWANDTGTLVATERYCPSAGGSRCVVRQKQTALGGVNGCAVFCYDGPYQGSASATTSTSCPCPTLQQIDWY